jgi:hypothetical protein
MVNKEGNQHELENTVTNRKSTELPALNVMGKTGE